MFGKIISTGSYIPKKKITNNDIAKVVDTDNDWIVERTGIKTRYIMENESTAEMAYLAAKSALEKSELDRKDIDLIIVSSVSSNLVLPNTACYVQEKLGAKNAMCMDVNVACTGFMMAYNTAQAYINTGLIENAIIVGAEGLSKLVNWQDRGSCILFGDGAGAVVIKKDENAKFKTVMYADGNGGVSLEMKNEFSNRATPFGDRVIKSDLEDYYIKMDGGAVFRFALDKIPKCINELLDDLGMDREEIDKYILHQANERIINSIVKRLKIDKVKVPMNIEKYGNTSSACIPILLDEMMENNNIKDGDKVVMSGFGAGLTWAATYMEF